MKEWERSLSAPATNDMGVAVAAAAPVGVGASGKEKGV